MDEELANWQMWTISFLDSDILYQILPGVQFSSQ